MTNFDYHHNEAHIHFWFFFCKCARWITCKSLFTVKFFPFNCKFWKFILPFLVCFFTLPSYLQFSFSSVALERRFLTISWYFPYAVVNGRLNQIHFPKLCLNTWQRTKSKNPNGSNCYTPLSEPYTIQFYLCVQV